MNRHSLRRGALAATLFCAFGILTVVPSSARADSLDQFGLHKARGEAKFASGTGGLLFLAAGTALPLLQTGGRQGQQQSFRTADSLITSTLITKAIQAITREKRPDGSNRSSFPSGHATAAFAVAAMQAHYHPRQALLWYAGATVIGASRVQLERHYWHDVLAGAAVGYFTTQFELKSHRGLLLRPFISGDTRVASDGRTVGFSFAKAF